MSNSPGRWAVTMIKAFCAAIIFAATLATILVIGPAMETRYWPPVSKLTITAMYESDEGFAVVDAQFTKYRDCEYLGIAWFIGDPAGDFERVPVILQRREGDTSSPNRPTGTQKAGPWIVGVSTEQLTRNSFARLSHRCNPFWVTTTDFYP